jgi:adenylate cyclase
MPAFYGTSAAGPDAAGIGAGNPRAEGLYSIPVDRAREAPMKMKKREVLALLIPLVSGLVFALLSIVPNWRGSERGLYDAFLFLKPAVKEAKGIFLLDVDDQAINQVGMWPWPRSIVADGLVTLRELGAGYAVFDIEYVDKSAMGVDTNYLQNGLKTQFDLSFKDVKSGFADIMNGLASKTMDLRGALDFSKDVLDNADAVKADLYGKVAGMAIDNDAELGKAMRFMGSAYVTVMQEKETLPHSDPDAQKISEQRFALKNATGAKNAAGFPDGSYTLSKISSMAKGVGLTNVEVDQDGKRRRIQLVARVRDALYAQLIFAPLLDRLGNPAIEIGKRWIVLKGAKLPAGAVQDIRIPLDDQGYMLVNWPKQDYDHMFHGQHDTFLHVYQIRQYEKGLGTELLKLVANESWQYLNEGDERARAESDRWANVEALRRQALDSGLETDIQAFLGAKAEAMAGLTAFAKDDFEAAPLAALDTLAAKSEDPAAIRAVQEDLRRTAANVRADLDGINGLRALLGPSVKGSMVIMGWTSSATTDMGANPFHKNIVNVGTHAAVANTILNRAFLREAPAWLSALLCLLLPLLLILSTRSVKPAAQNVIGISAALLFFPLAFLVFLFTGYFIAPLAIALAILLASVSHSVMTFVIAEREKSFLRKAFGTYLSGAVIDQIVADPGQLKLGGSKRWMTAMFTDVRGFSTISEKLDPESLVSLLNRYLTAMSDIILERHGTIDKYEGDAIISFFGAPIDLPGHAAACIGSAVLMKRREAELNELVMEQKLSPTPLVTRIGINSGEMVVGNMGTEKKMDYTIMGNAVNLAARLEGVNKRYGSWILASDAAHKESGNEFLARRFDRVRVVGINTPVQLWEILDFAADANQAQVDMVGRFHEALAVFEAREIERARELFGRLHEEYPADGPSRAYFDICGNADWIKRFLDPAWDGVFSLSEK